MIRYFEIAGIIIKVIDEVNLPLDNKESLFLTNKTTYDYEFEFIESDNFTDALNKATCIYQGPFYHIFNYQDYELRAFFTQNYYYGVSYIGENKGYFYFLDKDLLCDTMIKGPLQLLYLCFEKILLKHDGLILHSSFVNFKDKAILFSAPSGTGKSTQANLWEKYKNAEIINGDRAVLITRQNKWYACGLPMNGTSGICQNKSFEIGAVVLLKQGTENKVRRITQNEAFKNIYREITINNWNIDETDKAMQLIDKFTQQINIYLFECKIDEDAVNCLYNMLKNELY